MYRQLPPPSPATVPGSRAWKRLWRWCQKSVRLLSPRSKPTRSRRTRRSARRSPVAQPAPPGPAYPATSSCRAGSADGPATGCAHRAGARTTALPHRLGGALTHLLPVRPIACPCSLSDARRGWARHGHRLARRGPAGRRIVSPEHPRALGFFRDHSRVHSTEPRRRSSAQRPRGLRPGLGRDRHVRHRARADAAALPDRHPRHRRRPRRPDRVPAEGVGRGPEPDRGTDQRPVDRSARTAAAVPAQGRPARSRCSSHCCSPRPTWTRRSSTRRGCW